MKGRGYKYKKVVIIFSNWHKGKSIEVIHSLGMVIVGPQAWWIEDPSNWYQALK